jgi:hypothetical protein
VLYCEGEQTEPAYFEALRREPDVRDVAAVDLRVEDSAGGSSPLALVRMAVDARERSVREEGEIDEIWCVFDVEWPTNHPNLQQAIDLARGNGVFLAISNPCFEIWLILHFREHAGSMANPVRGSMAPDTCRIVRTLWSAPSRSIDATWTTDRDSRVIIHLPAYTL